MSSLLSRLFREHQQEEAQEAIQAHEDFMDSRILLPEGVETQAVGQGYTPRSGRNRLPAVNVILNEPQASTPISMPGAMAYPDVSALNARIDALTRQCSDLVSENLRLSTLVSGNASTPHPHQSVQTPQTPQSHAEPRTDAVTTGFLKGHYRGVKQSLIDRQNAKRTAEPFRK